MRVTQLAVFAAFALQCSVAFGDVANIIDIAKNYAKDLKITTAPKAAAGDGHLRALQEGADCAVDQDGYLECYMSFVNSYVPSDNADECDVVDDIYGGAWSCLDKNMEGSDCPSCSESIALFKALLEDDGINAGACDLSCPLGTGVIVGIVVGVLAAVVIIAAVVFVKFFKKEQPLAGTQMQPQGSYQGAK